MQQFIRGDLIDRFRIIRPLDAGGMGDVYLALDTASFTNVALKVLSRDKDDYELVQKRFHREADLYRRIAHPNIVGVIASGQFEGFDYIALEHIRGRSLARYMRDQGTLPIEQCESIMRDLVYALHAAHQENVIHRDIKPHNIMVTEDGVVKLIDFGVAKDKQPVEAAPDLEKLAEEGTTTKRRQTSTAGGSMVGTPAYASPEQIQCQPIDARTDIYSLGLVFYEMFTSMRVLSGASPSEILLCQSKLDAKIIPPTAVGPHIRPAIEAIILKMVRYKPVERFQSTLELLEAMHDIWPPGDLSDEPSSPGKKIKELARLELTDTYYWKAMNLLEKREYLEAIELFRKLLVSSSIKPQDSLLKNMLRELDVLFWTLTPSNALEQEVLAAMKQEAGAKLKTSDYLRFLLELLLLYDRLGEGQQVRLVASRLRHFYGHVEETEWEDPDVARQWAVVLENSPFQHACDMAREHHDDYPANADCYSSQAEHCLRHDNRVQAYLTFLDLALVELDAPNLQAARAAAVEALKIDHDNPRGLNVLVEILHRQGIQLSAGKSHKELVVELLEAAGLYDLLVKHFQELLQGMSDDIPVCKRILTLQARAGHHADMWRTHFHMGRCLLDLHQYTEAREHFLQALGETPARPMLTARLKDLQDIHKVFSIYELSQINRDQTP